jgi:4-amino-4-deoxy-L-arabinose transferase-like glycosyltransferase
LIWLAFLIRGAFYCVEQPLWEGFDEWAHFAYVQHLTTHGELPQRQDPISLELHRSLRSVPLSQSAAVSVGGITHDEYWSLTDAQRLCLGSSASCTFESANMQPGTLELTEYEAQQPPLYYVLMALAHLLLTPLELGLPIRVLVLRLLSIAVASLVVFLGHAIAQKVLPGTRLPLLVALLIASIPGLFIDMCRIGNDCLAIVLGAALVLLVFRVLETATDIRAWTLLGLCFAGALLTKAYFLALLPVIPLAAVLAVSAHRLTRRRTALNCAWCLLLIAAAAGWWYGLNILRTGTVSGEQIDAASANVGIARKLWAATQVDWVSALDTAAFTHIWVGGWSFLVVRSWMYHFIEGMAAISGIGLVLLVAKHWRRVTASGRLSIQDARLLVLMCSFLLMCAALGYYVVAVFLTNGKSMALGWYLYAVIAVEVVLLSVGFVALFRRRVAVYVLSFLGLSAACLDVYTVHFLLAPYYSGLIARTPSGHLETFHARTLFAEGTAEIMFRRLAAEEASIDAHVLPAMWAAYMCVTLGLAAISLSLSVMRPARIALRESHCPTPPGSG